MLFLGSFPPQPKRWSMPFFYPNWNNDFWRVMGLIFHEDRDWFTVQGAKRFDQQRIEAFCREQGIALYDTACEVRCLQDNASDKFLEVVEATDIPALLEQILECQAIITTGQKATDVIVETIYAHESYFVDEALREEKLESLCGETKRVFYATI